MKVVYKLFLDFEKEEQWLNQQAKNGLAFKSYNWGKYQFKKATPGEYIYRIELLKKSLSLDESKEYIKFMQDVGVDLVYHSMRYRRPAFTSCGHSFFYQIQEA